MRPSPVEVRRPVAAVVATAERAAALRPDAAWPRAAVGFSRDLAVIASADPPDPAAVARLARAYDAGWRDHQAAPSFHFTQALADVGQMHRCRWCGYDLRGSPARCPECGRSPDAADPGPSAVTLAIGTALQLAGGACLLALVVVLDRNGWVRRGIGPAWGTVALVLLGIGGVLISAGRVILRRR